MSAALFTPFQLGDVELANRIVVSPMCQYSAVDGSASDWHVAHLSNLAMSGAALVFVEATAVEPRGRITPGDLGLYSDDNERALGKALAVARAHGTAKMAIQLAHAGRKASCASPFEKTNPNKQLALDAGGWTCVAPQAIPFYETDRPPAAMDDDTRAQVKRAFVDAALRAGRLGFDVVELHCAHGYLMHEHLSPVSNPGKTLEERMQFPLEVFDAMRAALDARVPLGVRVSSTDWLEPEGWRLEDTVAFARALRAKGCAFVDCSSGGSSPHAKVQVGPGFQVPFAARVRAEANVPTIAVGMITDPKHANAIVEDGSTDLVALARAMLWNPRWGWHAAEALGVQTDAPAQARLGNAKVLRPHVGAFTRSAT
jgi:2,4-dienoyl-CoA reductase-like NADH-dependent reductase (Old Yellow Enzyme family)